MFGTCALCEREADLRLSHLVPEFFERRLKADSGTPFFRGANPNLRSQSGPKMWLLCDDCELRFSDDESEFARDFYHPTRDGQMIEIVWTRGLARFMVSITWRNLVSSIRQTDRAKSDIRSSDWALMETLEPRLRDYLMGRSAYPRDIEHHVFVPGANAETGHRDLNTILNMAILTATPATDECVYSAVIVPGMVLVALLNPTKACRELWRNATRTVPGGTLRNHAQWMNDGNFGSFLVEMAKIHFESDTKISPRQREIIAREMRKNRIIGDPNSIIERARQQDIYNKRFLH
jgi:hypothetical protein